MIDCIIKIDSEWCEELDVEIYCVICQVGIEWLFLYLGFFKGLGYYDCVCCGVWFFDGDVKFESYCGWFSFFKFGGDIDEYCDVIYGMICIEVCCYCCDVYLGYVFLDGLLFMGLCYCINGVVLIFVFE